LIFWSDATLLTQFGTMRLWPIYLMPGNLLEYVRTKMDSGDCHHVAHIPSVCSSNFANNRRSQIMYHAS
jgi:hypothetical protein